MGNRKARGAAKRQVKRAGRVAGVLGAAVLISLFAIQFVRIANQNIAMAHTLSTVQSDVRSLREREHRETMEIQRLGTATGAIPEIHDRLHLVRSNEAIVYLKHIRP